jgi:hypothetical protein
LSVIPGIVLNLEQMTSGLRIEITSHGPELKNDFARLRFYDKLLQEDVKSFIPNLEKLMPICRDCRGTGQRELKKEITTRCPDCDGTKVLKDGTECKRCNRWGEIGTGEFQIEKKLCTTCMGSGKVSEGSVTAWFLVRVVPTTLILLGGGVALIWASWTFVGRTWLTASISIVMFGLWGGAMYYFIKDMPSLGEISVTNWFLIRAIPTTLVALGAGGPAVWASWVYGQNAPVTSILTIAVAAIWGVMMYFFISHLPE